MPHLTRRSLLQLAGLGTAAGTAALRRAPASPAAASGQSARRDGARRATRWARSGACRPSSFNPDDLPARLELLRPAAGRARAGTTARRRGRTASLLREYEIVAVDREIEIAPGHVLSRPGPTTARCPGRRSAPPKAIASGSRSSTRARIRTRFTSTAGIRRRWTARCRSTRCMPGEQFVYEFDAEPFGLHLYHCHAVPLKRHIHKGLYGVVHRRSARRRARRPTSW